MFLAWFGWGSDLFFTSMLWLLIRDKVFCWCVLGLSIPMRWSVSFVTIAFDHFPSGSWTVWPSDFLSFSMFCYFPFPHELKIVIDYYMSSIARELIDFLCIDLVSILLDPHQHIWPSWGFCECCDFLFSILWTAFLLYSPSDGCGLAKLMAGAPQFGPTVTDTLPIPAWLICSEESSVANATFFFSFDLQPLRVLVWFAFCPLLVFGFLVFRTDGIWGMLRQLFHTYTR